MSTVLLLPRLLPARLALACALVLAGLPAARAQTPDASAQPPAVDAPAADAPASDAPSSEGPSGEMPDGEPPAAAAEPPMDDDNMVAPPVVDPKAVETQAVPPGGDPLKRPDGFGDAAVMQPVPVLMKQGYSNWDQGFQSIVSAVTEIDAELARLKLTPTGAPFILYTSTDDGGFQFEAEVPFTGATTEKPKEGFAFSASPAGKAMRFTHRGPYDAMDPTYEQISNLLDAKDLEAQDLYIEEYRSDPRTTPQDDLVIDIWVPLK
ncbi:GyrI-like domain-containing protein [Ancylobacter pratisalsi]|uniref:GyrI-like domain-containing protein n=1 Tax=Ancylobacter pratisalsi TaxID=1745854 RepID=A0A6P1YNC0_9HYPH|nr:GyrI-like domain-containing protein [Ancylobacter pratisalsi]QIB34829.1 GyrI-like domain-containing protein [Ancylobacter pratisalsi]